MYFQPLANWFAFILITYLLILSVTSGATTSESASQETLKQLQRIEESVNGSADPCDDFYGYACGNWEEHHPYYTMTSMYTILYFEYDHMMTDMFRENYPTQEKIREHNQTFVEKTLFLYHSCASGNHISYFEDIKPATNLEWPLTNAHDGKEQQNFDNFDVFAFLGKLFSYGFNNVVIESSLKRLANGTLYISLAKPDHHDFDSQHVSEMLNAIGFTYDSDKFKEYKAEIKNTHELWESVYNNYNQKNEDAMTYDQLRTAYPKLFTYLENMLPNQIQNDDIVEVNNLNYMDFLVEKRWQSIDTQNLCNYLMAEFFKYMRPHLNESCQESVRRKMHLAVNFMFYQHYIKPNEHQYNEAFDSLLAKIYKHLLVLLEENNLKFTDNLLQAIKEKLNRVHTTKGNLPDNVDVAMVEEFYRDVPDLSAKSRAKNLIPLLKHRLLETINCPKYMECIDEVGPSTGNIPEDDLMIVPFASFIPPMYHWNFDPLFSVSLLGTLLGHEFTHSMDTSSLTSENVYETLYDDFNNHPEFNEAKECMLDQEFTSDIRERVADFAGARVAYQVYKKEYNMQPTFTTTPWQQLFFLNMAQYFCQQSGAEAIKHDASDVRLRQIAMNMNEFAQAFECPVGSKMNPQKKCRFY